LLAKDNMMSRELISSGSPFEEVIGYSRAVVDGDWVFVAGTTGFNYETMEIVDDVAVQCEQTFENIGNALRQAGADFADVVRVTYILPDRDDWPSCWPVTKKYFDGIRPASTMLVAQLQDPRMRIEIEVTAKKRA
jgi:enamine deaminase RidA (YjgF/YER057c/UK114 family)